MIATRDIAALTLGVLFLTLLPLGGAAEEVSPLDTACNNLLKGNAYSQQLRREELSWKQKNRLLARHDREAWIEAHDAFVAEIAKRRQEHTQRVVQCSATTKRRRTSMDLIHRKGGFILYPSRTEVRLRRSASTFRTQMEERTQRHSYFQSIRTVMRKTPRSIREEYFKRWTTLRLR